MNWPEAIGKAGYVRHKGMIYLEPVRQWVLPALLGSASLKFLGVSPRWAVGIMLALGVVWEVAAFMLGWWEHRSGASRAHYQAAADTDPYRSSSLALLREIKEATTSTHDLVAWFYDRERQR